MTPRIGTAALLFAITATLLTGCAADGAGTGSTTGSSAGAASDSSAPPVPDDSTVADLDADGICALFAAQGIAVDLNAVSDAIGFDVPSPAACSFTYDPKSTPGHELYQIAYTNQEVLDAWAVALGSHGWTVSSDSGGQSVSAYQGEDGVLVAETTDPAHPDGPPTYLVTVDFDL